MVKRQRLSGIEGADDKGRYLSPLRAALHFENEPKSLKLSRGMAEVIGNALRQREMDNWIGRKLNFKASDPIGPSGALRMFITPARD